MTLPVFRTAKQAYAALWRHKASLLRFALLPSLLAFAACLASERALVSFPDMTEIGSLGELLSDLALVPLVVQAYRLFLLGPGDRSYRSWYWLGSGYFGVLVLTVAFWFLMQAPGYAVGEDVYQDVADLLIGEARPERFAAVAIFLVGILLYVLLSIRFAFLYPSLSLGESLDLAARWRETSGYFWRLFMASTLVVLPLLVVIFVAGAASVVAVAEPAFGESPDTLSEPAAFSLVESILFSATMTLALAAAYAAAAAVFAVAYVRLTGFPAQGLEAEPA